MSEDEPDPILCGICHVPVNEGNDAEGHAVVVFPSCGASDSAENAVQEATEYLLDKVMREEPPEDPPKRSYRFILGD
jgi:hypothetical protein